MIVTFRTMFVDTVIWLLQEQSIISQHATPKVQGTEITLTFEDDSNYQNLTLWTGAAISCGLILSYRIERV